MSVAAGPEDENGDGRPRLETALVVGWAGLGLVAAAVVAAIAFLAPVLAPEPGALSDLDFLPLEIRLKPEPLEQLRYLMAICLPVLLVGVVLGGARRLERRAAGRRLEHAALAMQAAVAVIAIVAWVVQRGEFRYFTIRAEIVALLLAATLIAIVVGRPTLPAVRRPSVRAPGGLAWLVAGLAIALGLSFSLFTETNAAASRLENYGHLPFAFEEVASVLAGRTPTVDFVAQYASVLPLLAAPVLEVTGLTVGTFTGLMAVGSLVAMLCVFSTLRTFLGGPWPALALFLPVLSLVLYPVARTNQHLHYVASYYAVLPLRYLGPLACLALCAGALRAPSTRRHLVLGLAAGLTVVNNFEFGLPAVVATLAAVAAGSRPDRRPRLREGLRAPAVVCVGAVVAVVGFLILTLVRTGEVGDLAQITYYSRQFALAGFFLEPLDQVLGLGLVVYGTFSACAVVGLGGALLGLAPAGAEGRMTAGLLTWIGIFGLGALAYWVGRSEPQVLISLFCAWAVALALLAVVLVRHLRRASGRTRRLAILPALLVLFHASLAVTTLAEPRGITGQLDRIRADSAPGPFTPTELETFVADCADRGEAVAIIAPLGQGVADTAGVEDRFPFNHPTAVVTRQQIDRVLAELEDGDVKRVFGGTVRPELRMALRSRGFRLTAVRPDRRPQLAFVTAGPSLFLWTRAGAGCRSRPG